MRSFPDTTFIVWTGAALTEATTTPDEAQRTREFFDWVKTEWDEPGDNIFLWDFYAARDRGRPLSEAGVRERAGRPAPDRRVRGEGRPLVRAEDRRRHRREGRLGFVDGRGRLAGAKRTRSGRMCGIVGVCDVERGSAGGGVHPPLDARDDPPPRARPVRDLPRRSRGSRERAPEHHRPEHRPAAHLQRRRVPVDRVQRGGLQPPGAETGAGGPRDTGSRPPATPRSSCTRTRSTARTACPASTASSRSPSGTAGSAPCSWPATGWASAPSSTRRRTAPWSSARRSRRSSPIPA